jgi:hypothetical protein
MLEIWLKKEIRATTGHDEAVWKSDALEAQLTVAH